MAWVRKRIIPIDINFADKRRSLSRYNIIRKNKQKFSILDPTWKKKQSEFINPQLFMFKFSSKR
jgi:hypothetical protein